MMKKRGRAAQTTKRRVGGLTESLRAYAECSWCKERSQLWKTIVLEETYSGVSKVVQAGAMKTSRMVLLLMRRANQHCREANAMKTDLAVGSRDMRLEDVRYVSVCKQGRVGCADGDGRSC